MAKVKRVCFSYRELPEGGEVSAQPKISDEVAVKQSQHLIFLIHGFNVNKLEAENAYNGFHKLQDIPPDEGRYGIGRTFVEVYWPGDASFASFLFYQRSIQRAIKTAEQLADYLVTNIGSHTQIDIVAHSMGCRLATELLRALKDKPVIDRIVFMAGAIPTFMLDQGNPSRRLRPSYNKVLRDKSLNLYSTTDRVLTWLFPAGESLDPREGFLPTALGHDKWIDYTVPINFEQQQNPGAGHSDYWGQDKANIEQHCAKNAAQEVQKFLQFPSAGSRTISNRPLKENVIIEARKNGANRKIINRDIPAYVS